MSKFKDPTEPTPPLSSDGKTEDLGQQSNQSVNTEQTNTSTQTLRDPLQGTSKSETGDVPEKAIFHATLVRISLGILLRAKLIKRYDVHSKPEEGSKLLRIRYEFDLTNWTENLELRKDV